MGDRKQPRPVPPGILKPAPPAAPPAGSTSSETLTVEKLLEHIESFVEATKHMRELDQQLLEAAYKIDPVREHWKLGMFALHYSGKLDLKSILSHALVP